jgi:hypothetical protein
MLTGCATLIPTLIKDVDQGDWIGIEPGSTLTLHQPMQVAPSRTRVFFVNGRARNAGANYQTACALEVRRIDRDRPQTIPAGRYRINRVQNYWTQVVDARGPSPTPISADGTVRFRLAEYSGDDGQPMIQSGFHFWLDDSADPNLMRLTCLGVLAEPAEAYPPTLQEIAGALGPLATLEVVGARSARPVAIQK